MSVSESKSSRAAAGGEVELRVEVSSEPWTLPIDAVVLSVGGDLGELAQAFADQYPKARLEQRVNDGGITPDKPGIVMLREPGSRGTGPWLAVLATPHDADDGVVTARSIEGATRAAVSEAMEAGALSVGVPLLGTGALRFPLPLAAAAAVPAAIGAARPPLRRLVFITPYSRNEPLITDAVDSELARLESLGPAAAPRPRGLAGGVSADRVDPNAGIPLREDRLGVAPYVSMLATVISDRHTPTPLSVGIFGTWGSGKSYFMGLLREQIDRLAASGNPDYCVETVQISFNAWHYSDTNIWASLGDEIFRQLVGPGPGTAERRSKLRAELAERLDQRREVEVMTEQARSDAAQAQTRVEDAARDRDISVRELLDALRNSPRFQRRLRSLWGSIGVTDEAEQAQLLAEQLRGTLTEAEALRRSPLDTYGRWALGGAVVAFACYLLLLAAVPTFRNWLAGSAGAFLTLSGTGVYLIKRARSGLSSLRSLTEDLRGGLSDDACRGREERVAAAMVALREAEANQRRAETRLHDLESRIGELDRQLAELQPGQRLYSFLADRASGDLYTGNLGLISTIRKDFEQLVALMADWRLHPRPDSFGRRPIDRIVLYIDDLDRCNPQQVVDVLQAVHLLLALDLFVVVIGVDSRWLLRSLTSHYAEILEGSAGQTATGRLGATPEDYLEKIINIPIALPGMPDGGLRRLLAALTDDGPAGEEPNGEWPGAQAEALPIQPASVSAGLVETGSEIAAQQRAEEPAEPPRGLTEDELGLLSALDTFVDTPRQAKRLINLYRMLRATRDLSGESRFLGEDGSPGDYQAVAVLLGVLTADPRVLEHLLFAPPDSRRGIPGGLMHRSPGTPWSEFLADVEPHEGANAIVGALHGEALDRWRRIHHGLTRTSELLTLPDLASLQRWAPVIRRFAYTISSLPLPDPPAPVGG